MTIFLFGIWKKCCHLFCETKLSIWLKHIYIEIVNTERRIMFALVPVFFSRAAFYIAACIFFFRYTIHVCVKCVIDPSVQILQ